MACKIQSIMKCFAIKQLNKDNIFDLFSIFHIIIQSKGSIFFQIDLPYALIYISIFQHGTGIYCVAW